jgi:hypothetical protein
LDHLARRIARARWDVEPAFMAASDAPADAVTFDLRTKDNVLSLWRCSTSPADVREVVLAMVSAFQDDPPEKIFLVVVPASSLVDAGIILSEAEGRTPVADLRQRHVNAEHLTARDLSNLAQAMASSLGTAAEIAFTRKQFINIVADAVSEQRVKLGGLGRRLREEVEETIAARGGDGLGDV